MLDTRTILVTVLLIQTAASVLFFITWQRLKSRFNGLELMTVDHLLRALGLCLMLLRGHIPDFFSIVVANTIIFIGFSFIFAGLQRFFYKKASPILVFIFAGVLSILLFLFTFVYPSLTSRTIVIYGINAVQWLLAYRLLAKQIDKRQRVIVRPVAVFFLLITLIDLLRITIAFYERIEGNFFAIHSLGTLSILVYSVLIVLIIIAELFLLTSVLHEELLEHQRTLEMQVKDRTEQLVQAEKLATLGTLSAGIAHEINNPNNFILMNTEILEKGCIALQNIYSPDFKNAPVKVGSMSLDKFMLHLPRIITDIHDGAHRIALIVATLKEYASPSPKSNVEFNLNDAACTAAQLAGILVNRTTEHFHQNLHPEPILIHGYIQKIEHAISNLLQNAAQSLTNASQGITLTTGIDNMKSCAFVEVRDEGHGITPETIQHITDPFFTTRRSEGGTGLGLWMVQHIVSEHDGELLIDSQVGKGTTMRIVLPTIISTKSKERSWIEQSF